MKNRFSKIMEKDGFYIILFICVCVVAITAVWASRGNLNKEKEDNLSKAEDFIIMDEKELEPSLEIARMEEDLIMDKEMGKMAEESEEQEEQEESTLMEDEEETDLDFVEDENPPAIPSVEEGMMVPVEGKIGMDFTTDGLIYSETLEEWTSHKGIDIFAQEGSEVKAVLPGEVIEVYEDPLWGIVIIIDHGNGLMTKYANLSTKETTKEGLKVTKGQVINRVGKSASIEMMMEPHIHFEVIKDGVSADPKDYLPMLSYSN
ncbi:MAG TPA: M23 family metallopeptidase [Clostridia bacterium]|nr:M23 family metallopeptidase [Clostridia bacterium]